MGRKPKYPDAEKVIADFYNAVSESFNNPSEDEKGREGKKKQELLAEEFGISRLKVRKTLITTGDVVYPETKRIQAMLADGMELKTVCEKLRLSNSTLNSLLPYSKGVYKLSEVSAAAERTAVYRARLQAVQTLQSAVQEGSDVSFALWNAIIAFQNYPFTTSGRGSRAGVSFTYVVSDAGGSGGKHYTGAEVDGYGNELWIVQNGEKREKSITRSSVDYALQIALEGEVTGPKGLKIYGSSYVYSIFKRFGLV